MRILLILLLSIVFSTSSFSKDNYLEIKKETCDYGNFEFPIISGTDSNTVYKINTHLQLAELELMNGYEEEDLFERVAKNSIDHFGRTSIRYEIKANNEHLLSVYIYNLAHGGTSYYRCNYYNFNPQNGERYFLEDLIKEESWETFSQIAKAHINMTLLAFVDTSQYIKELNFEYASFEALIENVNSGNDFDQFYFQNDTLYIDIFNSLHKAHMVDGYETITAIPIKRISFMLSKMGEDILIKKKKDISEYYSNREPQLYSGKIDNKHKFILLLKHIVNNEWDAVYAYTKYGKGILLDGKLKDETYILEEKDKEYETIGKMEFQKDGEKLSGYYYTNEGKKLKLEAQKLK